MATIEDRGQGNVIDLPADIPGKLEIAIHGHRNRVRIGAGSRFPRATLEIRGNDCRIDIGEGCVLIGEFRCRESRTELVIGDATTSMNLKITMHEAGRITIGDDCMFSGDVRMDVSDMHSIIDVASGLRINPPADIAIGRHVWVGYGVYVMKGVSIGPDCVVGACSVVTHDVPANSLAVGTPAKVIRGGITWDRKCLPMDASVGTVARSA